MKTKRQIHTIDATDQVLGRLAVRIAILLRGKQRPDFLPNRDAGDEVVIKNIGKIRITGKKMEKKKFYRHSGYPGGLRATALSKLFQRDPAEVLRKAVWGMLPRNKLRAEQIKRLKFEPR